MPIVATHHSILANPMATREEADLLEEHALDRQSEAIDDPFQSEFLLTDLTETEDGDSINLSFDWDYLDSEILQDQHVRGFDVSDVDLDSSHDRDQSTVDDDQLTGLLITDNPAKLPQTLLESNRPPLLDASFQGDRLLAHSAGNHLDYLSNVDAIYLSPYDDVLDLGTSSADKLWIDGGDGYDTLKIHLDHAPNPDQWRNVDQVEWYSDGDDSDSISVYGEHHDIAVKEDDEFSINLDGIFPNSDQISSVSILPTVDGSLADWIGFEVREPDSSLVDHVLIESRFSDENGNSLLREDFSLLADGSIINVDLSVKDNRYDGSGLIGLELDLSWNEQSLEFKNVELSSSLPLFQSEGTLDHLSGSLNGLIAASLPSAGYGSILGDDSQDTFASLQFEVIGDSGFPLDFEILPQGFSASKDTPLDAREIFSIGSNPQPRPLLYGLADQSRVGQHEFALIGDYENGGQWVQTLDLSVENTNDRPYILSVPELNLSEDRDFSLDLSEFFADSDVIHGDRLTFTVSQDQSAYSDHWYNFNQSTGVFSGRPDYTEVGSFDLSVVATDLYGEFTEHTFQFEIQSVNDRPIASLNQLPDIYLKYAQDFLIPIPDNLFTDEEDQSNLKYSIELIDGLGDSWIVADNAQNTFSGSTPSEGSSTYSATLRATDSQGLSASSDLIIHLVDELFNRLPRLTDAFPQDQAIHEGESVHFDLKSLFDDEDTLFLGDQLSFDYQGPSWLQFDLETGILSGTASNSDVGDHTIVLSAVDSKGATAVGTYRIFVENLNQAPQLLVPTKQSLLMQSDSSFSLDLDSIFNDEDLIHGDWLSYSLLARSSSSENIPDWLSWNSATGQFSLNPGSDDRGVLSLLFSATDRHGLSTSYQLDIGIVSEDGLVEVNQALGSQHLAANDQTSFDLKTLFLTLKESSETQYAFELYRPLTDGGYELLGEESSDWVKLLDRSRDTSESNRLVIDSQLVLSATGEEVSVDDVSSFSQGTEFQLVIDVSDNRDDVELSGLLGLDLELEWSGFSLATTDVELISRSFTDKLPLFRSIDVNRVDENYLRFTGASLPSFMLGEPLGDQERENLIRLDFTLDDPTQPILFDLDFVDEKRGGLGYALADATKDDFRVHTIDLSTEPLHEIQLNPHTQHRGNYLLKIIAEASDVLANPESEEDDLDQLSNQDALASDRNIDLVEELQDIVDLEDDDDGPQMSHDRDRDLDDVFMDEQSSAYNFVKHGISVVDSVHQTLSISIGDGYNLAPVNILSMDQLAVRDEFLQVLPLNRLFDDLDDPSLSYQIQFDSVSSELSPVLKNNVYISYQNGVPELVFDVPHLSESVHTLATITVSDGMNQLKHAFQLTLHPDSNVVDFSINPNHPPVAIGDPIGLGDFFTSSKINFLDSEDYVELKINASLPIALQLSDAFLSLTELDDVQASRIQQMMSTDVANEESDIASYLIPISPLSQLSREQTTVFDLNWLEFIITDVDGSNSRDEFVMDISTQSRVADDLGGILYGYSASNAKIAKASISRAPDIYFASPATERYLPSLLESSNRHVPSGVDLDHGQTLFAWKTESNYNQSISSNLDDVSSIVTMSVNPSLSVFNIEPAYRFNDFRVMSLDEEMFLDYDLNQSLQTDQTITSYWDPICFALESISDHGFLQDIDLTREGTQVEVVIDLSGSDLLEGDFNAYRKYVSADAIEQADQLNVALYDLDQNLITHAGWYDFTQRFDQVGIPIGDGARFVVDDVDGVRKLTHIVLTLTDNQFGDNDLTIGRIFDPGMPIKIELIPSALPDTSVTSPSNSSNFNFAANPNPALIVNPQSPPLQSNQSVDLLNPSGVSVSPSSPLPSFSEPRSSSVVPSASGFESSSVVPTASGFESSSVVPTASGFESSSVVPTASGFESSPVLPTASEAESLSSPPTSSNSNVFFSPSKPGNQLNLSPNVVQPFFNSLRFSSSRQKYSSPELMNSGRSSASDLDLSSSQRQITFESNGQLDSISPLGRLRQNSEPPNTNQTESDPLKGLFNSLMSLSQKPSMLVGLMMGMVLAPAASAQLSHSFLKSGFGRAIQIRRKNRDLNEAWPLSYSQNGSDFDNYTLHLKNGRLFLTRDDLDFSSVSEAGSSNPHALLEDNALWTILVNVELPGEMIQRLEDAAHKLLSESLDAISTNWCSWLDDLADECCLNNNSKARLHFQSLIHQVEDSQLIDPSLADATILIQTLDCLQRLAMNPASFETTSRIASNTLR